MYSQLVSSFRVPVIYGNVPANTTKDLCSTIITMPHFIRCSKAQWESLIHIQSRELRWASCVFVCVRVCFSALPYISWPFVHLCFSISRPVSQPCQHTSDTHTVWIIQEHSSLFLSPLFWLYPSFFYLLILVLLPFPIYTLPGWLLSFFQPGIMVVSHSHTWRVQGYEYIKLKCLLV